MSVVKINAITVPKERAEELEARFAARAGEVSESPGFEAFELLRPTDDRDMFLVYTRWASEDDFQTWMNSAAFQHGHQAHNTQGPVSTQSELWAFDVVQHEEAPPPSACYPREPACLAPQLPRGLGLRRDRGQRDRGRRRARRVALEGGARPVGVDRHDHRRGRAHAAGAGRARSSWRARTTWRRASTCSTASSRSSPWASPTSTAPDAWPPGDALRARRPVHHGARHPGRRCRRADA